MNLIDLGKVHFWISQRYLLLLICFDLKSISDQELDWSRDHVTNIKPIEKSERVCRATKSYVLANVYVCVRAVYGKFAINTLKLKTKRHRVINY